MSIEDVALKRDDSDIIQFDNIFSNDLAREQQLDLLFGAKEDDDIIKMIESRLFDADGEERVFVEAEDDEEDEDENEVDISNNDSDGDKVDDDMEEAPAEEAAPKIAIDIDADEVNINADDSVKECGDVNVTAQVVNITPNAAEAPMTGADLATALSTDDDSTAAPEEIPAPVTPDDNEPAPEPDQAPVNGVENVVGEDFDNTRPEPAVGDSDEEPAEIEEGVQELNTSSDLEDALNAGLEPAPAPEETSPTAEPEDPSTEVVFGDSNDMEEKSDIFGEDADAAVRPEDDTVIGSDDGNITHGEAPKNANDGIPETEDPAHKDTSETQVGFLPRTQEELEDAMGVVDDLDIAKEAAKEPEDPNEEAVENDAETSLLGIEPTLTAGDLDKIFNNAEEDPNKSGKYSQDLNEADEPTFGRDILKEEEDNSGEVVDAKEDDDTEDVVEEECKGCDSEPAEDQGAENIDNNIKVPETADDLAKELDNIDNAASDAEESEKETISGEEGTHSKADEEWEDAAAKSDITSDEKLDAAKNETGYKDNRDAGDNDTSDELNEAETVGDLEDMLDAVEDEVEPDPTDGEAPMEGCGSEGCGSEGCGSEGCGSEGCGSEECESCKEEFDGIEEVDKDGGNKSDDNLSSSDFATEVEDPKNDGDDKPIVDDAEQAGKDKEDGGAINTDDANPTIDISTKAELEAVFSELAADSTEVIPDEVEVPKEDGEYDDTVKKTKVASPGNDGSDVEVGTYAESVEDLEKMLNEDFEDQVEGISDDEVFDAEINTGLDVAPEDEELEEEIDDEALDVVESMN